MRLLAKTVNNHNHNWWCKLSAAGVSSKTKEAKKQKKEGSLRHWICLWGQTVVRVILKSMMHEETHGDPTYLRPVTSEEEMPEWLNMADTMMTKQGRSNRFPLIRLQWHGEQAFHTQGTFLCASSFDFNTSSTAVWPQNMIWWHNDTSFFFFFFF